MKCHKQLWKKNSMKEMHKRSKYILILPDIYIDISGIPFGNDELTINQK